jgi:hypothetical protein
MEVAAVELVKEAWEGGRLKAGFHWQGRLGE